MGRSVYPQPKPEQVYAECDIQYGTWIPEARGKYSITPDGIVYSHRSSVPRPVKVRNGLVDIHLVYGENTTRRVQSLLNAVYSSAGLLEANEAWIPGYENEYSYTSDFMVYSHKRGKKLKRINKKGYVMLSQRGVAESVYLHTLPII